MGKTKSRWRRVQRQRLTVVQKKIWTAEFLPPLVLKYGGKLPTPKIFFFIIAVSLSLMDINTTRLRRNCDKHMKGLKRARKLC